MYLGGRWGHGASVCVYIYAIWSTHALTDRRKRAYRAGAKSAAGRAYDNDAFFHFPSTLWGITHVDGGVIWPWYRISIIIWDTHLIVIYICTYTYTYVFTHIHVYIYTYIYMIFTQTVMYYIYVRIYIYTHIIFTQIVVWDMYTYIYKCIYDLSLLTEFYDCVCNDIMLISFNSIINRRQAVIFWMLYAHLFFERQFDVSWFLRLFQVGIL